MIQLIWERYGLINVLVILRRGFVPGFVNYKKVCTRLASASDKVYQLLAHGQWFSPGTPASSTTKTGRHDIHVAEILLKVALKHQKSINLSRSVGVSPGNLHQYTDKQIDST